MKSMKKLVLAALILLASVVVLAGCKNDSVPEVSKYTVTFDKNAGDATGEMAPQTFTQGEKKELTANAFVRPTLFVPTILSMGISIRPRSTSPAVIPSARISSRT